MSRNSLSHFKLDPNIAASNKRAILFSSGPTGRSVPATGSAKEREPGKATAIAPATKVSFRFHPVTKFGMPEERWSSSFSSRLRS